MMFSKETYRQRRADLQARLETGLLLFLGNSESPMNYADNCYPFRQDSSFLYYFGLDQPDLAAVIDVDEGRSIIFGDELTIDHIVWMGDLPTIAERAQMVGVTETRPRADLARVVSAAVGSGRPVHFLPPYRTDSAQQMHELFGFALRDSADRASLDLIRAVVDQRRTKRSKSSTGPWPRRSTCTPPRCAWRGPECWSPRSRPRWSESRWRPAAGSRSR
jgi:Xaa-Pro aminopeptidase